MHLAVVSYEPRRRLILATPKLLRNLGIVLLVVGGLMVLLVPFGLGVTWLLSKITDYQIISTIRELIEQNTLTVVASGLALSVPYGIGTVLVTVVGIWSLRRRREVEIDCSVGAIIERERFLRSERELRFPLFDLVKGTCRERMKSAGGRRGGTVTSYAVNLVFNDGSVVHFESLDARLPAMLEQVLPHMKEE